MDVSAYLILVFFPFLMAYAAFSDLFTMTISNKISLFLLGGFAFFAWQIGMDWSTLINHLSIFGIVMAIGFTAFAFNLAGGGDVKLLACTSLWLGSDTIPYLIYSSFFGAFFAVVLLKFRAKFISPRLYEIEWIKRLHQDGFGMPYGVALSAGAMVVFPSSLWMEHVIARAIS